MGIPLNLDFEMGVAKPIDSRFVMTKAQMLSVDDNVMPQVYGCWCTDDGKYYIYNKNNTTSLTTGKFVEQPDEGSLRAMESSIDGHSSYIESITELQRQVANIQDALKANKEQDILTNQVFTDGVWKKDFLPDHEKSYFCQKVEIVQNSDVGSDEDGYEYISINGSQQIELAYLEANTNSTLNIKVVYENSTLNVYCNDVIVGNVADTIILTIEVTRPTYGTHTLSNITYEYSFVEYSNVNVTTKNTFPITENYNGEILYWSRTCVSGGSSQPTYSLSGQHSKAVYSIGNFVGNGYMLMSSNFNNTTGEVLDECIIRYIYMANWDLSGVTNFSNVFTPCINNDTANEKIYNADNDFFRKPFKKLDFTKVKMPTTGTFITDTFTPLARYGGEYAGSIMNFYETLKNIPTELGFGKLFNIKSLGDLSNWDVSKVISVSELFQHDHELEYVGDIGKWNIGRNITNIKNMFRLCFKLRGISSAISDWDLSNNEGLNSTFSGTFWIGDSVIRDLWKWDTSKCINFRMCFSYCSSDDFRLAKAVVGDYLDNNELKIVFDNNTQINSGTLTDEQIRAKELQNLTIITKHIAHPKTDCSFVDQWNVSLGQAFSQMFAFNPYLINLGDLRKWVVNDDSGTNMQTYGFRGFIMYCTALETLYMPSIPRGVNVVDFAKGCTSLANIELDELNVEAISFGDSPLTKQSVLNLVNAATDDVTITLRDDIYNLYYNDTDVVSAINTKAGSGINVVLGM